MSNEVYKTVKAQAKAELIEKKSRFIAIVLPVSSEDETKAALKRIKSEYKNADHYVYAWIISGENPSMRSSDDGEPQGTAGKPILELIRNADLSDLMIVVVRYFGGTLLGNG